ncbi:MAG: hypothetical protein AVDCRST_MAG89-175, partial [uncultured Gemmatimonadetes bacterium]
RPAPGRRHGEDRVREREVGGGRRLPHLVGAALRGGAGGARHAFAGRGGVGSGGPRRGASAGAARVRGRRHSLGADARIGGPAASRPRGAHRRGGDAGDRQPRNGRRAARAHVQRRRVLREPRAAGHVRDPRRRIVPARPERDRRSESAGDRGSRLRRRAGAGAAHHPAQDPL